MEIDHLAPFEDLCECVLTYILANEPSKMYLLAGNQLLGYYGKCQGFWHGYFF